MELGELMTKAARPAFDEGGSFDGRSPEGGGYFGGSFRSLKMAMRWRLVVRRWKEVQEGNRVEESSTDVMMEGKTKGKTKERRKDGKSVMDRESVDELKGRMMEGLDGKENSCLGTNTNNKVEMKKLPLGDACIAG
ncbi:hypothetical protein Droror1_Dr00016146 [Drosera rotundifolia]